MQSLGRVVSRQLNWTFFLVGGSCAIIGAIIHANFAKFLDLIISLFFLLFN